MLTDKVVIVTGGAGLLGRAVAQAIVTHGGIAIIADVDLGRAAVVAEALSSTHPGRVTPVLLDIADPRSVTQLIAEVKAEFGRIDGLVNNAYPRNAMYGASVEDVTYKDFCENVNAHLGGYFLVTQRLAEYFKNCTGGSIVSMGSVYGEIAPRFELYAGTSMTMPVEYAAIKSGVIQLTRYFAKYYRKYGVRVNCVSPGGIVDNQPATFQERYRDASGTKGMLSPEDVTGALVFMLSDASRYITGQNLVVDDGFSL
jgi:NAD(P)-dependent dehydrogenase (short-subunit alcohol dehydrogenase family)